jgi:hypothetical protein
MWWKRVAKVIGWINISNKVLLELKSVIYHKDDKMITITKWLTNGHKNLTSKHEGN